MIRRRALSMLVVAAALGGCRKKPSFDAGEVVRAALAAHGGPAALAHLRDLKVVSKARYKEKLDLERTIHVRGSAWSMRLDARGRTVMAFGVDGDRCWREQRSRVTRCTPDEKKEYDRITDVLGARLLVGLDPATATAEADVTVGGAAAREIRQGALAIAFDSADHRLRRIRYDGGWVETFGEFRSVGGALIATRRTLTIDGEPDVDERWIEIVPGGADPREIAGPPLSEEGTVVDAIDPPRPVAWEQIADADHDADRHAAGDLDRFANAEDLKTSASDDLVLTFVDDDAPTPLRVAIGLEDPPKALQRGAITVERWPEARFVGVFHRGDPRDFGAARATVERTMEQAGVMRAPGAKWQALASRAELDRGISERLWLHRIAVVPKASGAGR